MPDIDCRMAKAEQCIHDLREQLAEHREDSKVNKAEILEAIDTVIAYQQKQKGFISGVTFTVGAIFTVVTAGIGYFWKQS